MKHVSFTKEEINALNPAHVAVAQFVGGDDVLVRTGVEIIKDSAPTTDNSLMSALDKCLEHVSGNSFEIVVFKDNQMVCALILDWS